MTKTLAIASLKGGVAKSASAHNLAAELAAHGTRVLMIDLDPQASLTHAAGVQDAAGRSMAEVMTAPVGKAPLADLIVQVADNLWLAPADLSMAAQELSLAQKYGREAILKHALAGVRGYDLIILDCPPSLGILSINALVAADAVIVPAQPQPTDLRSVQLFMQTFEEIHADLNPNIELLGILLTFYDERINGHKRAAEMITKSGRPLLAARIGRTTRIADAAGAGKPLREYEPRNKQNTQFAILAKEVSKWLRKM